jgi:predicted amidophosphoribosyltransferase
MMKKIIDETRDNFQIKDLCLPMSVIILTHLSEIGFIFPPDCLLSYAPIPAKEARSRGFDQAREITKTISDSTGLQIYRSTEPIQGRDIILFDDLYDIERTEAYARSLKDKGVKRIIYIPAAR